ncbi:MAG TPA: ABC transporter permease [Bryobacteraceae bacterium]|nr:ABC transporter permease [Bryobacteraceae bacterium]
MTNKLVIENLRFRPVRTILSVLAIGIEVVMILTIVGISRGMIVDSQRRMRGVGADVLVRPPGSSPISLSSAPIPEKMVQFIERQPHVTMAVGAINYPVGGLTVITGVDVAQFTQLSGGFHYIKGGPPRQPNDLLIDRYYAHQNKLEIGSPVPLMNRRWRVCGIYEEGKLARLVIPIGILQDLTSNAGKLSQIFVKVDNPADVGSVVAQLKAKLTGYQIYSLEEFMSLTSMDHIPGLAEFIGVVIGLSIIVGFLVVFLSMYTAVLERTREIGILKALGASPSFVLGILMRETLLLAIGGSLLGIGLSFGTRWLIMTLVPGSLSQYIVPDWWPIAGAIALAGALLGSAYPGWRAARQDPIEALAYE